MIKAVFIDVDDTLLDFRACAKEAMQATMKEFGMVYEESMFPVFWQINSELWQAIQRGELTREGLWEIRWNRIFAELGIQADGPAFETAFHDKLAVSAVEVEGAREIMAYLASRYRVFVTTNAPHYQQVTRLTTAGMIQYVEEVFTSEKIGASKPSEKFFKACFAALPDIKPEETVIIGDSLTADIRGGVVFGMKTCWFNPDGKEVPQELAIDYVVHTLAEIENWL